MINILKNPQMTHDDFFLFQIALYVSLAILAVTICRTSGAVILAQPIEYVITHSNPQEVPVDLMDPTRIKRSGSGDIFGYVKKGIQSKFSQIAKASSGAVAHFSKHSSGPPVEPGYHYGPPVSINKNTNI